MALLLVDLNECLHGHRPVVGHYCPTDAECVNTDGSFDCKCPANHMFIDRGGHDSECQGTEQFVNVMSTEQFDNVMFSLHSDIDECVKNPCPDTFNCSNTKGSYECICQGDYELSRAGDRCIRKYLPCVSITVAALCLCLLVITVCVSLHYS